jgi:AAA domain
VPFPATGRLNEAAKHPAAKFNWKENVIAARDLCDRKFAPMKWVIPGLFSEGVTLLASRPKVGKSWLLQQIGAAKASGMPTLSAVDISAGDVLYLNLEDGWRRAQRRMRKYFGDLPDNWPDRLKMAESWRLLGGGGLEDLQGWCASVPKPTLIMIDTLAKVRSPKKGGQSDYMADYQACEPLMRLTREFAGLGIIVATHVRKMEAEDVFDTVSGTLGLTGGVDAIAILKRSAGAISLHIEGRDLPDDLEKAVRFDRETCRWEILGGATEVNQSDTRKTILEAIAATPLRPREISDTTGIDPNVVRQQLFQMASKGLVAKEGDRYRPAAGP